MARVVFVGPDSQEKGGMATVIENFKQFYAGAHKVAYVSSWKNQGRMKQAWLGFTKIYKLKKISNVDILHFHVAEKGSFFRKSLYLLFLGRETKIIFHMHAAEFDKFYENSPLILKKYISFIFNRTSLMVALSEEWQQFYQGLTKTKVIVVGNAVEIPTDSHYTGNRKQIITLGRVGKRKGSYDIVKLAKKIQEIDPEIKFVLYGDGEKAIEEITMITKKEEIHNLVLGGWLKDKEKVLSDAALHLLPSYHEGVPMAILETMSYGIPNLSTNVGGIPQVIKHNENGYLVEPGDIHGMLDLIVEFFSSEAIRKHLSKQAMITILQNHSLENYFVTWDQLYQKVLEGNFS